MSNENLIDYIENLNLRRQFHFSETVYFIDDSYSITIEFSRNVFIINNNTIIHRERYIFISDLDTLKHVYHEKTGKDIEVLMRKEKLKQLELCSR